MSYETRANPPTADREWRIEALIYDRDRNCNRRNS